MFRVFWQVMTVLPAPPDNGVAFFGVPSMIDSLEVKVLHPA